MIGWARPRLRPWHRAQPRRGGGGRGGGGDGEPHIRVLIEQSLGDLVDEGVEILSVGDGQAALDTIKARRPALVVLDAMMPKMSGFDVCRVVKKDLAMDDVFV